MGDLHELPVPDPPYDHTSEGTTPPPEPPDDDTEWTLGAKVFFFIFVLPVLGVLAIGLWRLFFLTLLDL